MTHNIALGRPTVGPEELAAVAAVFESGWLAGQGPTTKVFEGRFAERIGVSHAMAVNNCTAGLHLALGALGVGPGDEVICADYTYPATSHSVAFTGATPRFADVHRDTALIDPDSVASLIGEKTVGVIAVDTFGQCAEYAELRELTKRHGLFLVEDAACAAGATYRGIPAGHSELADIAAFSLHGRKGITSGEGGVVTTSRSDLAAFVAKNLCFGVESALSRAGNNDLAVPQFTEIGYNYKLSDIASAIANVQLDRLDDLVATRQRIATQYIELLGSNELLTMPVELAERTHPWQSFVVTLAPHVQRGSVAQALRDQGIGCNIGTFACHVQPVYGSSDVCPVSADIFEHHLAIPMHAELSESDVAIVAEALTSAVAAAV